jgi:hypothetical protein
MTPPTPTTAVGRVMIACGEGDTTDPLLPGSTDQYTAILAAAGANEAQAYRIACGALAAYYAAQGDRISSGAGKSIDYRERVKLWRSAASGGDPLYPFDLTLGGARGVGTGANEVEVVW